MILCNVIFDERQACSSKKPRKYGLYCPLGCY